MMIQIEIGVIQINVITVLITKFEPSRTDRFAVMPGNVNIRYIEIFRYIEH